MELPQEILDELEADAAAAEEAEVQEDDGMQTEDIYRVYMEELAAIPPCTAAENEELLGKVKAGVAGARERLIEGNLRNALMHVQNYINRGVPMADLIQEASMELMMLVDDAFEGSFEKLLESRIRVRMEEVISEQTSASNIEEEVLARVNVLQEVSKELAERFGREPKLEELAEYMKMTEDEVREIMKVTMDALSLSEANRALQS
ncbi:MAG: RNA polymerase subunit sigma-70 [Lachnospiraceae bacterium]|nr:RNA polymerase subunit sigma-70 [Lachnospiraceae bacterium]MBQ2022299.1 RNA polymerase subunit sigma-70 [Lachnospiraceae bacterium]MBQ2250819.1 RNA polymerase subunit sigma-70 [Lachnospiraceae bacterium]MBQ2425561.1 RNA polymerase subunit sigma-70 [Lachnospiraceae bacterium]MBQ5599210.1 RNA polymerase subunit sigma-70 [Lachnospiraceae bacterium]